VVLGALLIAGGVLLSRQEIDLDTFLNYFALDLLIFVVITHGSGGPSLRTRSTHSAEDAELGELRVFRRPLAVAKLSWVKPRDDAEAITD